MFAKIGARGGEDVVEAGFTKRLGAVVAGAAEGEPAKRPEEPKDALDEGAVGELVVEGEAAEALGGGVNLVVAVGAGEAKGCVDVQLNSLIE